MPDTADSPQLSWDEQGQPRSGRFNDFYFSRANGLEETRYVFLQHNQLEQRWQSLKPSQPFVIGETGFGTGLNFLTCLQRWLQQPNRAGRLHFVSVERYPLNRHQLRQALALWPELSGLAEQLVEQYPLIHTGSHRLNFDHGRVALTLMFDDASQAFRRFDCTVDAWFLDGFSPEKNPQMWSHQLFSAIASCSDSRTSFSTFTAASAVRKGLQACGFEVKRTDGFGKKREMLFGHYPCEAPATPSISSQPWFDRPKPITQQPQTPLAVLGAGLAGACSAFSLAQRGYRVNVYERGPEPGCGASGNPQGVLYAKLPAVPTHSSRIHLNGYLYSLRLLQQQLATSNHWSGCGVLQLALDSKQADKNKALVQQGHYPSALVKAVDSQQASQLAGITLAHGGLFYPDAGWVSPAELCRQLLSHPNIQCHFNHAIDSIDYQPDQQRWSLLDPQRQTISQTQTLIVATAHEARQFSQLAQLPIKPIRGQTTSVEARGDSNLNTVLCGNGYIAPAKQGRFCFGASFDLHSNDCSINPQDHQHNLELVNQISPELARQLAPQLANAQGRVGFRCAASDYLPIVGAVANQEHFLNDYALLGKDAKGTIDTPPRHINGLFVNLGHGSKGLITAPLAGELLADLILGEPLAIEPELAKALNPARFIIKKLIKGTI